MKIRIGLGVDFHQLKEGHPFILGGIEVPHSKGAIGHSDADVLLHAITDALFGALSMGDIGTHFPDTDSKYKNIDSKILLKDCYQMIKLKGWKIVNIDSTICLQQPKIKDYIPQMRKVISELLEIDYEDISIKATTAEKMGFVGREEGVQSFAQVLLSK
ncbi:MAG TPA: 2-C-methyl-D-erythritol 2,4-cyclodiphosphate synthase [Chitinophagaceae bacterium]|nr:2-C-methyl-D-erythritol 2,4-cyclodiphosphate synthase [Chitinophagaceae bacterium]